MTMIAYLESMLPPWLSKTRGRGFFRALGEMGEQLRGEIALAIKQWMIEECDPTTYVHHMVNSGLPRVKNETDNQVLTILRDRWYRWRGGGGSETMLWAIRRLGYSSVEIYAQIDLLIAGLAGAFGTNKNFFYVRINQPNQWTNGELWDGGKLWNDNTLWGLGGGTREDLDILFAMIRKFKGATMSCRYVEIVTQTGMVRVIPMHEEWENENGTYRWYYNRTYAAP